MYYVQCVVPVEYGPHEVLHVGVVVLEQAVDGLLTHSSSLITMYHHLVHI